MDDEAPKYFDAEGNQVEGLKSPDEIKRVETDLAAKEAESEELKKQLATYANKDFNFKKLRDMTEDEMGRLSKVEKSLLERQEKLEEDSTSFKQRVIESHKNDSLAVLAGDDTELRKKIDYHYGRIIGDATTKDEIATKMREAYLLSTGGGHAGVDQLNRAAGFTSSGFVAPQKKGELSQDQKDLASHLGLSNDDITKYSK